MFPIPININPVSAASVLGANIYQSPCVRTQKQRKQEHARTKSYSRTYMSTDNDNNEGNLMRVSHEFLHFDDYAPSLDQLTYRSQIQCIRPVQYTHYNFKFEFPPF